MHSRHRLIPSCRCSRTLPFCSTLLFLSLILPTSSFAQITAPSASSSPFSSASPTSTTSSTSSSSATPAPNPTHDNPAPSSPTVDTTDPNIKDNVFHFYFLIIAVVVILFCLCVLYIGRRKKRKAAIMRSNSQRALARDVEGFRTRLRGRTGLGWNNGPTQRNRSDPEEGLDERGEAPPPYVPGTKPPSLRSVDGVGRPSTRSEHRVGEAVELVQLSGDIGHPPGYHEHHDLASGGDIGITRPDTAVTASDRFGFMRRLISHTGSSYERDGDAIK